MEEYHEFRDVPYNRFRDNFASLKRRVRNFKQHAAEHETMMLHDLLIYDLAEDTDGCWDGSDAQRLLERDIKKKRHLKYKPQILWLRKDAYQEFSLQTFRGHIHQILRRDRETPYWTYKKAKKKESKKKKARDEENEEELMIEYAVRELG
mmetsp:Transcript_28817/g.80491  ORF Transcript_28817/g.80491 Transcript_28817/m.80491 type:complete len:150 (+) Transcript_28817:3-452(+)